MASRAMIISGYVGDKDPNSQVDPFLRHLLGKFEDELGEADQKLYEYTSIAAMGDLWQAVWDDEELSLTIYGSGGPDVFQSVRVSREPAAGVAALLPALYKLNQIMEVN